MTTGRINQVAKKNEEAVSFTVSQSSSPTSGKK